MAATPAVIVTGEPGHPAHPIAPGGPVGPPDWGIDTPVDPGFGVPLPPIHVGGGPSRPPAHVGGGPVRPNYPVDPDYDLPVAPGVWPHPPRPPGVWPPMQPIYPSHPIYVPPGHHVGGGPMPGGRPDQGPTPTPPPVVGGGPVVPPPEVGGGPIMPPGSVWPPLPPSVEGKLLVFCWIVGIGYRWTVIDTTLEIGGGPVYPPHTVPLPPHVSTQPLPGGERPSHQPVPTPPDAPIATPTGRR